MDKGEGGGPQNVDFFFFTLSQQVGSKSSFKIARNNSGFKKKEIFGAGIGTKKFMTILEKIKKKESYTKKSYTS